SSHVDSTKKDSLSLTVINSTTINGVTISPKTLLLYTGGALDTVTATLNPSTSNLGVTFRSTDTATVKVSSKGIVTAWGPGTASVLASPEGLPSLVDSCS